MGHTLAIHRLPDEIRASVTRLLTTSAFYLGWLLVSAASLVVGYFTDPYIFALIAFITAGLSGAVTLLAGRRNLGWALLAATPTLVAFVVLSTFKWA